MKDRLKRFSFLFLGLGIIYALIEIFFTAIMGLLTKGSFAFIGHTSLWMILVGGLMGIILGEFNRLSWLKINLFWQSIIGMCCIYIIEYFSGIVLNVCFGLNLWNYKGLWFNINGQITFLFAPLWFGICPLAFWADDWLRSIFFGESKPASIWIYYNKAFNINDKPA